MQFVDHEATDAFEVVNTDAGEMVEVPISCYLSTSRIV